MRLIDADALLKGIEELKQSPWYENFSGRFFRKEAVEIIEDLCIKEEPTIDAVEVVNRPICHELFTDGRQGVTMWLKNGDIIEYYPNKESEVEE